MLLGRLVQLTAPQSHHWSDVCFHQFSAYSYTKWKETYERNSILYEDYNYRCNKFTITYLCFCIHSTTFFLHAGFSEAYVCLFDDDVVGVDGCYAVVYSCIPLVQTSTRPVYQLLEGQV